MEEKNGRLQACVDTYRNYILPRATKEAHEMIERNQFAGIKIVTCEEWAAKRKEESGEQDGKNSATSKGYLYKQEKTDNFYGMYERSAKNLTKDDLCVFLGLLTKEMVENGVDFKYELEKEPKIWDVRIKGIENSVDFLPTEPIKVADMLINFTQEYENKPSKVFGGIGKEEYKVFDEPELRQIAEHLLVYCNYNSEASR